MSNAKPSSLTRQLLTDLQGYFVRQPATHYPTEQLLNYLAAINNAPWATLAEGKAITARHMARLLQPYGIVPKNIRVSATSTPKGYKAEDFKAAFAQLSDLPPHAENVAANVAANVADKKVMDNNDVAANEMTGSDVADHVAANLNKLVNVAVSDVADNDVAANVADYVVDKVDVADRKRVVADNLADRKWVVTANVAAPVQTKPQQKWPPPKGWAWNQQNRCYEPPNSTVQPDPPDQALIRQTLRISPELKYLPGYGLVVVEPNLSA